MGLRKPVAGNVLLLVFAGRYAALTTQGGQTARIDMVAVCFALPTLLGAALIDPRIRTLSKAADAASDGPLSETLLEHNGDPVASLGPSISLATFLGTVCDMFSGPPRALHRGYAGWRFCGVPDGSPRAVRTHP